MVDPTFSNVEAYRAAFGIDKSLAAYLAERGHIAVDDDAGDAGSRTDLAVALLNAPNLPARVRVALVKSLRLEKVIDAELIQAEDSELFALLLRVGLVSDDRASFLHFREAGWPAIGPALLASTNVASFLEPAIVHGMVGSLLADQKVAERLGDTVVGRAVEFVPDDEDAGNDAALRELAKYAARQNKALPPAMVLRIARAGAADRSTILWLLSRTSPAATAKDIAGVFALLGDNYAKIAVVGATFEVPRDDLHDLLLAALREQGIVRTRRVKDKIRVTVVNASQ